MRDEARTTNLESLLRHREWIEQLAMRLLGDPTLADDVSQQVWLAAMESPPQNSGHEAGWLARVTRNLSLRSHRDMRRRERRERVAARPETVRSAADAVARLEIERRVTEAVLELPDEFRVVVVLRYFENRTPAAIAEELGIRAATVRTRLHRGLERLRRALDTEFDDGTGSGRAAWHAALLPLVSADASIGAIASTSAVPLPAEVTTRTGGTFMGTSKLILTLSVVIVTLGVGVVLEEHLFDTDPPGRVVADGGPHADAIDANANENGSARESGDVREQATAIDVQPGDDPVGGTASQENLAPLGLLYGAIRGADGSPAEAEIRMHPVGDADPSSLRQAKGTGAYAITGIRPGMWSYEIFGRDSRVRTGRIDIPEGEHPLRLDFSLATSTSIVVRLRNEAGQLVPPATTRLDALAFQASVVATSDPLPDRLPDAYRASYEGAGRGRFFGIFLPRVQHEVEIPDDAVGVLVVDTFPVHVHLLFGGRVVGRRHLESPTDAITFDLSEDDIRGTFATLGARVIDPSGAAVEGARIDQTVTFASGLGREVDETGEWVDADVPPGYRSLRLRLAEGATQELVLRVGDGDTIDLGTLTVDPDLAITGRVVDAQGDGVECSVVYELLDVPQSIEATTTAARVPSGRDGAFEIAGLVRGRYRLTAVAKIGHAPIVQPMQSLPMVVDVTAGSADVTLEARPARLLEVTIPGARWRTLQCYVEDESGARVATSIPRMAEQHALHVPEGSWRVVVSDEAGVVADASVVIGDEDVKIEVQAAGGDPFGGEEPDPVGDPTAPLVPVVEENRVVGPSDPVGTIVYGRIHDDAGNLVRASRIKVSSHPLQETVSATQPDGSYAVAGLHSGDSWILAIASGHSIANHRHSIHADHPFVRDDAVVSRTPELGFRLLAADGSEISMLEDPFELIITRELPDASRPVAEQSFVHVGRMLLDFDGRVSIVRREPGPFHVAVVRAGRIAAVEAFASEVQEAVVRLGADAPPPRYATVRFRCIESETGAVRVPDKIIVQHPDDMVRKRWFGRDLAGRDHLPIPVDEDGVVAIPNVGAGRIELRIAIEGREPFAYRFAVPELDVLDLGDLELTEATTLRVRFVDASGQPIDQSGSVRPVTLIAGLPDRARTGEAYYGARGNDPAVIPVGRREYELVTRIFGEAALQGYTVDVRSGDTEVTLTGHRGTSVHIDHGVASWSDARIRIEDANGIVLEESSPGAFPMLRRLAPGTHTVKILRAGSEVASETFEVGSEPLTVEVHP